MNSIKEFLSRKDVAKTRKILSYVINPIVTVFCLLGIFLMIIGNVGVIKEEGERRDKHIQYYINEGEYAEAYDAYFLERALETVSGEEFQKYAEFYEFYDDFIMYRIKNRAGKTDEAAKYVNEMHTIADTTEEFEMKPVYDYLLSLDENSFK